MTGERAYGWDDLDRLFDQALEFPAHERAKWLENACAGNPALREQVEALLRADASAAGFLELDAMGITERMMVTRLQHELADRYQIERELGRGGMATVYLARDLKHDRQVALKVLDPVLAAPLAPERFQREIRFAARLQHPHILPVHDSGNAAGHHWFSMPYVVGESLRQRLRREGRLAPAEAVRIAREVARALDYAHREGLVHRDIKPENILLSREGEPLVADFGIGRALSAEQSSGRDGVEDPLTATGAVLGTPAYMSLEQADGKEVDGRSDIYSLGVVLYEMLTGTRPFVGGSAYTIVAQQLTERPRPLSEMGASVPPLLEEIVSRMLARDPAERYATAGMLAEALEAVPSTGPWPRARRVPSVRSKRPWVIGAVALVAIIVAGVYLRSRRAAPVTELRRNVLAVAPFEVLDSRLSLWREGLVDLLARSLDGAGPLRTVPPTVVIRRWTGRTDSPSAVQLGLRTGAELVLYGSLLSSGRDSVRLRASLLDARQERPLGEWDIVDGADRMDRLTDSLTLDLLKDLGRSRPMGAVRHTALGGTSLSAIKAFLQGEQHFRHSNWPAALVDYQRAVELDSTFAQALRRVGIVRGWLSTISPSDPEDDVYPLRAAAHNHGLPPRDSLLIAADSLLFSVREAGPLGVAADTGWGTRRRRLFAILAEATARYPDDPEAWNLLADARVHFGPFGFTSYPQQLQAFDRAIALDSEFAPAYIHPVAIASVYGAEAMRRYLLPYVALTSREDAGIAPRFVLELLNSPVGRIAGDTSVFRGISDEVLSFAFEELSSFPDSTEVAVAIAQRLIARGKTIPAFGGDLMRMHMARALLLRGHAREAGPYVVGQENFSSFADAVLLGAVPATQTAAVFHSRLAGPPSQLLTAAFPWWTSRGDSVSLRRAKSLADSVAQRGGDPDDRARARYAAAAAAGYLSLVRGDTTSAVSRFEALPVDECPACYSEQLTLIQLLVELKRDREAWAILQGEPITSSLDIFPSKVLWCLLRGRVAERLGEREQARQSYDWVVGMWRNADPELQHYVREAREGLARLMADRPQ